jgi:hypothetical protein
VVHHFRKHVTLTYAERHIGDGWVALYRGRGWLSRWIQAATGGPYSHASLLCRENGHVDVLELREFIGPRRLTLDYHAQRWPGLIDVFSPDYVHFPEYNGRGAVRLMRHLTSRDYSYAGVAMLALRKIPGLRSRFVLKAWDEASMATHASGVFCSEGVAMAQAFGGGVEPIRLKPSWLTTLAWSLLNRYEFTIGAVS